MGLGKASGLSFLAQAGHLLCFPALAAERDFSAHLSSQSPRSPCVLPSPWHSACWAQTSPLHGWSASSILLFVNVTSTLTICLSSISSTLWLRAEQGASLPTPTGLCSVAATQTALGFLGHLRTWERGRGKQVHFPLRKISGLSPGNEKHRLLSFGWSLLIHLCSVSVSRCNLQLFIFYPLPNVHSEADGT